MRGITNIPAEGGGGTTGKLVLDSLVINEATTANDFIDLVLNKFYANPDLRDLEVINNSTAISLTGDASNNIQITGKVLIKALSNAIVKPETYGNLLFEINQTDQNFDNITLAELVVRYTAVDTYTYSVMRIKGVSTETKIAEPTAANLGIVLVSPFGVGERKYFIATTGYTYPAKQEISGSEAFTTIAGDVVYFEATKISGITAFNVTVYRNASGTLKKFVGFAKFTMAGAPPAFEYLAAFIGMHEEGQGGGGSTTTVVDSLSISTSTTEQDIHLAVFNKFLANADLRSVIVTIEDGATVTSVDLPIYPGDVLQYIGNLGTPTFPTTLKLELTIFKSGMVYTPTTPRHPLASIVTGVFSSASVASFYATMLRYQLNKQDTFPTTQALMSTIFNQLQNDFDVEYYLSVDQYVPYVVDSEITDSVAFDFFSSDNVTIRWAGYSERGEYLLKIELVRADGNYEGIIVKKTVVVDDTPTDHIALVNFHKV